MPKKRAVTIQTVYILLFTCIITAFIVLCGCDQGHIEISDNVTEPEPQINQSKVDPTLADYIETNSIEKLHPIIQFNHTLSPSEREILEEMHGIRFYDYKGESSYTALIPVTELEILSNRPDVIKIGKIPIDIKFETYVLYPTVPTYAINNDGSIKLEVSFYDDIAEENALNLVMKYSSDGNIVYNGFDYGRYRILFNALDNNTYHKLADEDRVRYMGFWGEQPTITVDKIDPRLQKLLINKSGNRIHPLMQLDRVLSASEIKSLEQEFGMIMLNPRGNHEYIFSFPINQTEAILQLPFVERLTIVPVEEKVESYYPDGVMIPDMAIDEDGTFNLRVLFYDDVQEQEALELGSQYGEVTHNSYEYSNNELTIRVRDNETINHLMNEDSVQYIGFSPVLIGTQSSNLSKIDTAILDPEILDVLDFWHDKEQYLNKKAIIRGTIEIISYVCTGQACPPEEPCCNGCWGELGYKVPPTGDSLPQQDLLPFVGNYAGKYIACHGTECNTTCSPFNPGENYTVEVILYLDDFDHYRLSLMDIIV